MATEPQQIIGVAGQSVPRVAGTVAPPTYDSLQADQGKREPQQQFSITQQVPMQQQPPWQQTPMQQLPVQHVQVPTPQAVPFQAYPPQGQVGYFQAGVAQGPVQYVAVS